MSVLIVCKILRPFVNTLTPNGKYSVDNREILKQPIQLQLSKDVKTFSQFFTAVLKSPFNFETFKKIFKPHSLRISKIMARERRAYVNV